MTETPDPTAELGEQLEECRRAPNPLDRFNTVVLQRAPYWRAQRQIMRALAEPEVDTVAVVSGHMTGKSYGAAGATLGWISLYEDSMVVSTGPTNQQINKVLWSEIRKARSGSPLLHDVGKITRTPNAWEIAEGWAAYGFSTKEPERFQGLHPKGPVLVVVDEASGVNDPTTHQALDSLNPRKKLYISNPIKDHGPFFDVCQRAKDDPKIRLIKIPSTDSPDILLEHSPRGLADAAWLRRMIADYGADSQVVKVRVKAEFPDSSADSLLPSWWLDLCEAADHVPGGHRRMAIDLGLGGGGGDPTVFVIRDDNGILYYEASNRLTLEAAASRAAQLAQRFYVQPARISWDAESIGADFGNRLRQVGLIGCVPYLGKRSVKVSARTVNLRGASHMAMRRRLDPNRRDAFDKPRPTFAIPREFMAKFRAEVREITISSDSLGRDVIRTKEDVCKALGHSPDHSDTLAQSFAFPNL